jgi:hypothetical protein
MLTSMSYTLEKSLAYIFNGKNAVYANFEAYLYEWTVGE